MTQIENWVKLVVVGDGGVGKCAITIQFFQKLFVTDYDPTIEDSYIQHTEVDGQWCILDVLDTAGQEKFSAMRKGDDFLLVYSVTDQQSFENIRHFHTQNRSEEAERKMARSLGAPYIETSTMESPLNVDRAFHELVHIICNHPQQEKKKARGSKCGQCSLLRALGVPGIHFYGDNIKFKF